MAIEGLWRRNWAFLRAEHIKTTHHCIRKIYLYSNISKQVEFDFIPCTGFRHLPVVLQEDFLFRKEHIHNLNFNPDIISPRCDRALHHLEAYIIENQID